MYVRKVAQSKTAHYAKATFSTTATIPSNNYVYKTWQASYSYYYTLEDYRFTIIKINIVQKHYGSVHLTYFFLRHLSA